MENYPLTLRIPQTYPHDLSDTSPSSRPRTRKFCGYPKSGGYGSLLSQQIPDRHCTSNLY